MKRCNKVLLLIVVLMISCAAILCANAATTLSISSPDNYDLFSWNHKITIKWNSVSGAAGYHVSVRKDGETDPCLYRQWVTGTSYNIADSIPANPGKYIVWVGAVETQGAASPSDWQDSIQIYIASEPAVTNGDASAINDSGATLQMSVDRDYGYAIEDCGFYIGTSSTKSQMTKYSFKKYSTSQGATSKGTKKMAVTGLQAGKKYYYRAYAVNQVGEDYSESGYFFTTGGTPETLSKPYITYPTNNSTCQANKSIKLQWNAVSGAEGYKYYVKQLSGTPDTSNNNEPCVDEWTGSVSSSRRYYTLSASNVKVGYWYKFVVEAYAEGAISGWSDWCYAYIGKGTMTKPVITSLTNWSEVSPGNAIIVDWDDVTTAAGYRCHIKRLSGQPDTSDNNEPALQSWKPDCGTTSKYTFDGSIFIGGYWYKFVVEAYDGGESMWSDWYYIYASETGKLDIPVITSPVVGDNCEAGKSIAFTWGKVANAEGYNYFIKELTGEPDYSDNESASKSWKGSTSASRRRFTLDGEDVQPNTWYKFVVEAKAEGYQSGWSRYTYIKIPDRVDWIHYNLPASVLEIRDETFSGNSKLRTFDASDSNLMRIGSNAFAGCKNLLSINLPATVEYIADDAFTNCPSVVFHCVSGSYAESYAKEKGIQVEQHGIAVESDMIQVSQTRWDPEGDAAQLSLDVTSSGNWKAKKSSNSSWLTLSATSGYSSDRITLLATKNTKSSKRTATVTFTCGDATAKVEIEQGKAASSGGWSGSTATPVVTGSWNDEPTIHVTLGDTYHLKGYINVSNGYLGVVSVSVYGGENQAVTKKYEGTQKTHIDNLGDDLWIDTNNNANFNKVGTYELTMYAKAEGSNEAVKIGSKTLVVKPVKNEEMHDYENCVYSERLEKAKMQYKNENAITRFVQIALSQVGYKHDASDNVIETPRLDGSGNGTTGKKRKYSEYGRYLRINGVYNNSDWCAAFISWCGNQAGLTSIPYTAGAGTFRNNGKEGSDFDKVGKGDYSLEIYKLWNESFTQFINVKPEVGDVVVFTDKKNTWYPSSHVAIVYSVSQDTDGIWKVKIVEGNNGGKVTDNRELKLNEQYNTGAKKIQLLARPKQ